MNAIVEQSAAAKSGTLSDLPVALSAP